jgi:hypothetical protein
VRAALEQGVCSDLGGVHKNVRQARVAEQHAVLPGSLGAGRGGRAGRARGGLALPVGAGSAADSRRVWRALVSAGLGSPALVPPWAPRPAGQPDAPANPANRGAAQRGRRRGGLQPRPKETNPGNPQARPPEVDAEGRGPQPHKVVRIAQHQEVNERLLLGVEAL